MDSGGLMPQLSRRSCVQRLCHILLSSPNSSRLSWHFSSYFGIWTKDRFELHFRVIKIEGWGSEVGWNMGSSVLVFSPGFSSSPGGQRDSGVYNSALPFQDICQRNLPLLLHPYTTHNNHLYNSYLQIWRAPSWQPGPLGNLWSSCHNPHYNSSTS